MNKCIDVFKVIIFFSSFHWSKNSSLFTNLVGNKFLYYYLFSITNLDLVLPIILFNTAVREDGTYGQTKLEVHIIILAFFSNSRPTTVSKPTDGTYLLGIYINMCTGMSSCIK